MLTDVQIRAVKPTAKPFKIADSHGLYLAVHPSGSKLWRYRYRIAGRANVYAIGQYPEIGLSDARQQRDEARKLVKQGLHPSHVRRSERLKAATQGTDTFEALAREWMDKHRSNWSPSYVRQVEQRLSADIFPAIGRLPIRQVTPAILLDVLRCVEARSPTVAGLLRQWCGAIFKHAIVTLRADNDPAAALAGALRRPRVKHSQPLARGDIPGLLEALDAYAGEPETVIALKILLHTFVRTNELLGAQWSEIDFARAEWRIPASRMKGREPHIVPLSRQVLDLLTELHALTGKGRLLFPSCRRAGACMSAGTLNAALKRLGYKEFTPHGCRATASTILNEMGYPVDHIERQLAHVERNATRASYNQATYLSERARMMQAWSDFIDASQENIVPLRA